MSNYERAQNAIDVSKEYFESNLKDKHEYWKNLYNGTRIKNPNTAPWRSNNFTPNFIFSAIQTELPRFIQGIIGNDGSNFFQVNGRTEKGTKYGKVISKIMNVHLQRGKFFTKFYTTSLNAHKVGTAWVKQIWEEDETEHKYYDMKGGEKIKEHTIKKKKSQPKWESPPTADIWWNFTGAEDKETLEYIVERVCVSKARFKSLEKIFINKGNFNKIMASLKDDNKTVEIFTVYFKDRFITIADKLELRDIANPFKHGNIPFYPVIRYPESNTMIGKGIPQILADIQESQNDIHNLTLDNIKLSINKILLRKKYSNFSSKNTTLTPGIIWDVDDVDGIKTLDLGNVHMDGFKMSEFLNGYVNQVSGNLDYMNAPSGVGNVNKTATGARIIQEEGNKRFAFAIQYTKENCIIEMLTDLLSLYQQYYEPEDDTLTEEEIKEVGVEPKDVDWNEDYNFIITGNKSLLDKQSELENLQAGIGMMAQLQIPFNGVEVGKRIFEVMDLDKKLLEQAQTPQGMPQGGQGQASPDVMRQQLEQLAQILNTSPEAILKAIESGQTTMEQVITKAQEMSQVKSQEV
jgi:hypothetical protein